MLRILSQNEWFLKNVFLQIGDRILRINGNPTEHLHHSDASILLRQLNGPITFHVFTPTAERHSISEIFSRSTEYLDKTGSYTDNLIGYQTGSMSSLAMSQMSTLSSENTANRISQLLENLPRDSEKQFKYVFICIFCVQCYYSISACICLYYLVKCEWQINCKICVISDTSTFS